jgi:hypothetical protein
MANKAQNPNPVDTAIAVHVEDTSEAKPKTLRQYETIVEKNAARGAQFWRIAAEALNAIKTHKLWRKAKDADGNGYKSFVDYAEQRFGFKKTYAYDLAKAATSGALNEGQARAQRVATRTPGSLLPHEAANRINRAFTRFEDAGGNIRDRAIDNGNSLRRTIGWLGKCRIWCGRSWMRTPLHLSLRHSLRMVPQPM